MKLKLLLLFCLFLVGCVAPKPIILEINIVSRLEVPKKEDENEMIYSVNPNYSGSAEKRIWHHEMSKDEENNAISYSINWPITIQSAVTKKP